jgi:GNAT superfamily N-acetyltransferase
MPDEEIRIERILVKDLVSFAERVIAQARPGQFIPITAQRAAAHAANPAASPEDVALLVAYQGEGANPGNIVGFFGILPIYLKRGDELEVVHWFSTWRVKPDLRGKSLGSALMKEALSLGLDVVIVGSGPARKVCRRFGFWERDPLEYACLDSSGMTRLNPAVWISRLLRRLLRPFKVKVHPDNAFSRATARLLSPLTRPVFSWLLERRLRNDLKAYHWMEVKSVQPETPAQRLSLAPVQFYRGSQVVNWMLSHPWVVEPGQSPTEEMDYYFSDVRQRFFNLALEVYSLQDDYLGYVVFQASTTRDRLELKILDVALDPVVDRRLLAALAVHFGRKIRAGRIDLPAEAVVELRKSRLGRLLLEARQRIYQCYPKAEDSPLALAWKEIRFEYSDGDMPFS